MIPSVEHLTWYVERLAERYPHDLSQSGHQHPWDLSSLASGGGLTERLIDQGHGTSIDPRDLVSAREGCAPEQLFSLALMAVIEESEPGRVPRVAVERPGFSPISQTARILGCEAVPFDRSPAYQTDSGPWRIDREGLEEILPGVCAVVLTQVQNPSGHHLDDDDLDWLIEVTASNGVKIVSDEVYLDASRGAPEHRPLWREAEHAISINSLTKCYGLGSIRFGWSICEENIARRMTSAFHHVQGMISIPSRSIATAVWPNLDEALLSMRTQREANLPLLLEVLQEHEIEWTPPRYGIFGCIPLPNGHSSLAAIERYALPRGLLAVPGLMFDGRLDGWMRIAWGGDLARFITSMGALSGFLADLRLNEP